MSVKVIYKNGGVGYASKKVAEILQKRGDVTIFNDAQPELIAVEKQEKQEYQPKRTKK